MLLICVLVRQPVVMVGTWPKGTLALSLKMAMLLIKLDEEYDGCKKMRATLYS
jgi:hypothetical protein